MLFNSFVFIAFFLPVTVAVTFFLARYFGQKPAISFLTLASLFFYAWWDYHYLPLITGSIIFNYLIGQALQRTDHPRKALFVLGVAVNLGLLATFKYSGFFVSTLSGIFSIDLGKVNIVLPLAISFFTFQQIAYLADTYSNRGLAAQQPDRSGGFLHYAFFISFFPQLIAGPIVHHQEFLPQLRNKAVLRFRASNLNAGITLFIIGLFKKVVLADTMADYVVDTFRSAHFGEAVHFMDAWASTLAYSMQIYFDFSGYSDMAIGLACLFGLNLPVNFLSPYKATSIADFWRRWHITLSRFLRDYLYIPLGGNRQSGYRTVVNIMVTMLLGGLWHGAAWTFLAWGGLHGIYLLAHRFYQRIRPQPRQRWSIRLSSVLGFLLTFLSVSMAWVLFRAESFYAALAMYRAMFNFAEFNLLHLSEHWVMWSRLGAILLMVWFMPNSMQLLRKYRAGLAPPPPYPAIEASRVQWGPRVRWLVPTTVAAVWALLMLNRVQEFIYFQF